MDATAQVITAVSHTGDLVACEDAASDYRPSADLVIAAARTSPGRIEQVLNAHPNVADAYVVGVPDASYGEELCAWIRPCDGASLSPEDVRSFCRHQLAPFKIPRYVLFSRDFPMTVTGKVQKSKLRDLSVRERGLA